MKGLDGIQGPIYLGTGCVFRRQAWYGIEAPMKEKHTRNTCNCWPKWCFLSSPARRSGRKRQKKKENKKFLKQNREISTQVHSLETILEEVAGLIADYYLRLLLVLNTLKSVILSLIFLQENM